jgi:SAM-dependent methyltransferase
MWDERYSSPEFVYGKEPNDFLVESRPRLPPGRVLCLAEGEGRNAVWLAQQGFEVTAIDASAAGLSKARQLAAERSVDVELVHADLVHYQIEREAWDGVVSIFCHLPPPLRARVHAQVVEGLRPGGVLLLEAYTPRQLQLGTGGPPVAELTMDLESLHRELPGLDLVHAVETERDVHEGRYHFGRGAVVQIIGLKPRSGRPA